MARRRKKLKGLKEKKENKLKDPDPRSEEYMYDEVDQFHRSKDKILLDPRQEEESNDDENDIEDEEVLAIEESDEEDNEDSDYVDDDINEDGDEDMSGDEDLFAVDKDNDVPNDKAWGKNKKLFYDADVLDEDVYASDDDAEQAAEDEEKEAMMLQKRMASNLDNEDFLSFNEKIGVEKVNETVDEEKVEKDLSSLTKKEKLELLAKQSPELLPLIEDYKEKANELKETYQHYLAMCHQSIITNREAVTFVEMKHQLLLSYLVNISFYLVLKASGENIKGHPIFDRLFKHKELLKSTEKIEGDFFLVYGELFVEYKNGLTKKSRSKKKKSSKEAKRVAQKNACENDVIGDEDMLEPNEENSHDANDDVIESSADVDPLEYYNQIKQQKEEEKLLKKQKNNINDVDSDADDENIDEDEKRKITYQISKNKGLIRKRRKELKNPRVKHKVKFKKAKIKHKGQVAEVKRELQRYGGELSGIKSSISKSVKIK